MWGLSLHSHFVAALAIVASLLLPATPAMGQLTGVTLDINPDAVGLDGQVRPGTWTPIRLRLTNHASEPRQVVCRWLLEDFDGDRVIARRQGVTLNPQATAEVWLYGPLTATESGEGPWTVQVMDAETNRLLASEQVGPRRVLEPNQTALGLMSSAPMGLQPYTERHTRHEAVELMRGLRLRDLPDRWYGLSNLESLIWTSEGGNPLDAAVSESSLHALREWVRRGGHLVIVLPTAGQTWTDSLLADMLPVDDRQMRRVNAPLPRWLYDVRPADGADQPTPFPMTVFDVDIGDAGRDDGVRGGGRTGVLLRDEQGRALVVAGRYGFGRVTLLGVDLADRRLVARGLPSGRYRVWNTVFGWQNPVFSEAYIADEQSASPPRMSRTHQRQEVELGQFMPPLLAMGGTAAPALLLAIVVFALYWLMAGPVAYVVLRQRGALRHAWLAFLVVVLGFSVLSWAGAWGLQGRGASIAHFSVVDVDGHTGEVRMQSWLSLLVPEFGDVAVGLGADDEATGAASGAAMNHNVIASPGLPLGLPGAGFLDPRTYELNAASPHALEVPFRSTAKQFRLDYRGPLREDQAGVTDPWVLPQGRVWMSGAWPRGELSHGLPGPLRNVLVVYCPGEGQTPWVWRHETWGPQEVLDLAENRSRASWLVRRPREYDADRNWEAEGFLGTLIGRKTGQGLGEIDPLRARIADNVMIQSAEMLSFYSMLPPPNFRRVDLRSQPAMYERELGRTLDISHLTAERRLIVIGYLQNAPLPAPLTVNGGAVEAEGWTMVRWIYDLK